MIQGPVTGAISSDSAADVTALTATVNNNTTEIALRAQAADLATAQGTISTHAGEIGALQNGFNNLGTSFYTKPLTDALLNAKQENLSNNGGSGIGLLNGVDVRQLTADHLLLRSK